MSFHALEIKIQFYQHIWTVFINDVRVKVRLAVRSPLTRPRRSFALRQTDVRWPFDVINRIPLIDRAEGVVVGDKETKDSFYKLVVTQSMYSDWLDTVTLDGTRHMESYGAKPDWLRRVTWLVPKWDDFRLWERELDWGENTCRCVYITQCEREASRYRSTGWRGKRVTPN